MIVESCPLYTLNRVRDPFNAKAASSSANSLSSLPPVRPAPSAFVARLMYRTSAARRMSATSAPVTPSGSARPWLARAWSGSHTDVHDGGRGSLSRWAGSSPRAADVGTGSTCCSPTVDSPAVESTPRLSSDESTRGFAPSLTALSSRSASSRCRLRLSTFLACTLSLTAARVFLPHAAWRTPRRGGLSYPPERPARPARVDSPAVADLKRKLDALAAALVAAIVAILIRKFVRSLGEGEL
mmetsp:Transcript_15831/g.61721  ORF Transcript_15831/g.61721 Transcript_15831/m.61721 type:complete len:241 (-) Transcript_15831:76-798(-)